MSSLALVIIAILVYAAVRARKNPAPPRQAARPTVAPSSKQRPTPGDPVEGWLIGHQIANGHHGFPGDPLPGGHLGSPLNLAFWGGMFDEDEDEWDHEEA
jgi:hypothetical protein